MTIEIKLDKGALLPSRAHPADAGIDLKAKETDGIPAHGSCTFNTGVHVNIPEGYVGFLKAKSGLNVKFDITGTGVIDAGYTGPIVVKLYNHSDSDYVVNAGDKIIQLVILPIITPDCCVVDHFTQIADSTRGDGGFGSSGK